MGDAVELLRIIRALPGSAGRILGTRTPPIHGPNAVAEYGSLVINGHPQRLLIRGADTSNPVLLYIPGGPGESNIWTAHRTMRVLEDHFVCVNWDPRGAPGSLHPPPPVSTLTTRQFIADAVTLIEHLLRRFGHRKLLLIGHSWGSSIAIKVAAERPDLLYALIGMGQEVDRARGEELSYRYALDQARRAGNRRAIRELEALGGSDTFGRSGRFVQRLWLMHFGGLVHSGGLLRTLRVLLEAPEYSLVDCLRYVRMDGTRFLIPRMSDELMRLDLLAEIHRLSIPVFFFEGRYDQTAPCVLAEELYRGLEAPHKELIWFEESGHPPDFEEPDKFQREVLSIGARYCRSADRAAAIS